MNQAPNAHIRQAAREHGDEALKTIVKQLAPEDPNAEAVLRLSPRPGEPLFPGTRYTVNGAGGAV